jgi:hypothetical protein
MVRGPAKSGLPRFSILMIPGPDQEGCIETLCKHVSRRIDARAATATDTFLANVHHETWNKLTRSEKAWLCANMAVREESAPFKKLGELFDSHDTAHLIPLDRKTKQLKDLISYLETFS